MSLQRQHFGRLNDQLGRTPRVNATGGRDHWGSLMSILVAGGGLKVGQVIGTSNANGEVHTSRPVSPTDVLATIYRHLGIDLTQHTVTNAGRFPSFPMERRSGNCCDEIFIGLHSQHFDDDAGHVVLLAVSVGELANRSPQGFENLAGRSV